MAKPAGPALFYFWPLELTLVEQSSASALLFVQWRVVKFKSPESGQRWTAGTLTLPAYPQRGTLLWKCLAVATKAGCINYSGLTNSLLVIE